MTFRLPPLPFEPDALEPFISAETLQEHHGKHHRAYLKKTEELAHGTKLQGATLERLVHEARGPLLNQAAQAWNHEFYFQSLTPHATARPPASLLESIERSFGDLPTLRREFSDAATSHFGSGWVWLLANGRGKLHVRALHDAGTPLREGQRPLLAIDVWEHAYYLDRRHDRAAYVRAFWHVVNWDFAAQQLAAEGPYVSRTSAGATLRAAS